jgi:hypothetical protein
MQVAFAFLLSCFFNNTRTANVCCYIWLLGAGLFAGYLLDNVFAADRWWATLLHLVPTFGAYRCALMFCAACVWMVLMMARQQSLVPASCIYSASADFQPLYL